MPSSVDSSPALEGSARWDTSLGWREESYRVSELEKAYFVVEHFAETEAIAHTMVSFRFTGDRFLVFSVEVRKELDETYSPLRGLFRQYELIYVVADERDALHLRTHVRAPASRVRIHPIDGDSEAVERYFLSLVERVNGLRGRPEFYNTVTSSCTTNLATHLEAVSEHEVVFDKRVYLPGYSSELVWELGLLGDIPLEEALGRDRVTDDRREAASADLEHYSLLIRGEDVPESPQDGSTPVEP